MNTHTHTKKKRPAHRDIVIETIRPPILHIKVSEVEPHLFVGGHKDGPAAVYVVLIASISIEIKGAKNPTCLVQNPTAAMLDT